VNYKTKAGQVLFVLQNLLRVEVTGVPDRESSFSARKELKIHYKLMFKK
jgi:hypothetical protein